MIDRAFPTLKPTEISPGRLRKICYLYFKPPYRSPRPASFLSAIDSVDGRPFPALVGTDSSCIRTECFLLDTERVYSDYGIQCRTCVVGTWLLRRLRWGRWRAQCCSMLVRETWEDRSSRYCIFLWHFDFEFPGQTHMVNRGLENGVLGFVVAFFPFPCRCALFVVVAVAVVMRCGLLCVLWLLYPSWAWLGVNLRGCYRLFCFLSRRSRIVVRCARTSWDRVVVGSLDMEWVWVAWLGILRLSVYLVSSRMRRNNYCMLSICRRLRKGLFRSIGMRRYTKGLRGR